MLEAAGLRANRTLLPKFSKFLTFVPSVQSLPHEEWAAELLTPSTCNWHSAAHKDQQHRPVFVNVKNPRQTEQSSHLGMLFTFRRERRNYLFINLLHWLELDLTYN